MKKAVVTGANGFVGAAVCRELQKQGCSVIAVIRGKDSDITRLTELEDCRIVYCELCDIANLPLLVPDRDVDLFYHFAWTGSAGTLRGDYSVQLDNVRYSCEAVKACAELGCKRFVFAASIMEYEIAALMNSSTAPQMNTLYSSGKLVADYMARTLAASAGVDYLRVVISNIYGPGETSPRLINTTIRKLLNSEHCSFSHGEQLYDFIFVDDAARAFYAVGENGISNRTYYLGSSQPRPLKEFLKTVGETVSPGAELGFGEIPFDGVSLSYQEFDVDSIKNDTGYSNRVTFEEGIRLTMDWMEGHK